MLLMEKPYIYMRGSNMQIRLGRYKGRAGQEEVAYIGEVWSGDRNRDRGLPEMAQWLR